MKCALCHGAGTLGCQLCDGLGFSCPTCRGMKWLRTGMIENGTYSIERCERCLTPALKLEAITRYLDNWKRWHAPQPEPQEEDDEEATHGNP